MPLRGDKRVIEAQVTPSVASHPGTVISTVTSDHYTRNQKIPFVQASGMISKVLD